MDAAQVRMIVTNEIDALKDALVPRIEQQQRQLQQQQGTIAALRGIVVALEQQQEQQQGTNQDMVSRMINFQTLMRDVKSALIILDKL